MLGLRKRRGWESDLIPIPHCPAHSPELNRALTALRELLPAEIPLAFVQASGALLTLVLKCAPEARWRQWAITTETKLRKAGIEGLQLNWNPAAGRKVIAARKQEIVFGSRFLLEDGHAYGALSFRQQIPELENEALSLSLEFFRDAHPSRVMDLYSGSGVSLSLWEKQGWQAIGVELVGEAVEAAKRNAPQSRILKGKVENRIPQLISFLEEKPASVFCLFTNPPRDGMSLEVVEWILNYKPKRIAYLSCNPRSQARDIGLLSPSYKLREAHPFDFFPLTDHVEALAFLEAI